MKSVAVWIISAAVVVAAGVGLWLVLRDDAVPSSDDQSVELSDEAETGGLPTACQVLTEGVAKSVLGDSAIKTDLPINTDVSTDDISVTNCLYDNAAEDVDSLVSANVLVRAAKTETGRQSNLFGFESNQSLSPENGGAPAEPISGLGDNAWYDPSLGQVNVLVDDGTYWLIVQAGDQNRALSEELARAVVANL